MNVWWLLMATKLYGNLHGYYMIVCSVTVKSVQMQLCDAWECDECLLVIISNTATTVSWYTAGNKLCQ